MSEGYIYIYKCVVGAGSDVCKIGITKDFHKRLQQHVRTPYYGFIPYIEFTTGRAIATVFKISDYDNADNIIDELFANCQFGSYEIYNLDYDKSVQLLYDKLIKDNKLIEFIGDGYSAYNFINETDKLEIEDTTKKVFEDLKIKILESTKNEISDSLIKMLKDKNEYMTNCKSHYSTGNYIEFPNNMILDLNFNKEKRIEIKNKLIEILNNLNK